MVGRGRTYVQGIFFICGIGVLAGTLGILGTLRDSCADSLEPLKDSPRAPESAPSPAEPSSASEAITEIPSPTTYQLGGLLIQYPYARGSLKGTNVGAVFMKIQNTGTAEEVLLSVTSPQAEQIEIHDTYADDKGVIHMRPLPQGLTLMPGETKELKPGGLHLMLHGLKSPLSAGHYLSLNFIFLSGQHILKIPILSLQKRNEPQKRDEEHTH